MNAGAMDCHATVAVKMTRSVVLAPPDAQIEHDVRRVTGESELAVQGVYQHPGAEVLVEGLMDLELL